MSIGQRISAAMICGGGEGWERGRERQMGGVETAQKEIVGWGGVASHTVRFRKEKCETKL